MTKKRMLMDEVKVQTGVYVRAWAEGRQDIVVQIWLNGKPEGDPDGDWVMPRALGLSVCIDQAILQTKLG